MNGTVYSEFINLTSMSVSKVYNISYPNQAYMIFLANNIFIGDFSLSYSYTDNAGN